MALKRLRHGTDSAHHRPTKRPCQEPILHGLDGRDCPSPANRDLLSPLSDELLVRILQQLSFRDLLATAPVSRRFHRLSEDAQLWRALFLERFVLPLALRIPSSSKRAQYCRRYTVRPDRADSDMPPDDRAERSCWKRRYRTRHNWATGKCAVGPLEDSRDGPPRRPPQPGKTVLLKVVEGWAITADHASGLRVWNMKKRRVLAQAPLGSIPSCLAVDEGTRPPGVVDLAIGFRDGSFALWRLDPSKQTLFCRYMQHGPGDCHELIAVATSYPYLLTATHETQVSMYAFDTSLPDGCTVQQPVPQPEADARDPVAWDGTATTAATTSAGACDARGTPPGRGSQSASRFDSDQVDGIAKSERTADAQRSAYPLPAPLRMHTLQSSTCSAPLALSVRKLAEAMTVASIAYTHSSSCGASIGLQQLYVQGDVKNNSHRTTTKMIHTVPFEGGQCFSAPGDRRLEIVALNYTHPYLLATLPDNTMLLHLVTCTPRTLKISPGIRLWGHTSGISYADITSRGKAVSLSARGGEMRVWELEGGHHSQRLDRVGLDSTSVIMRYGQSLQGNAGQSAEAGDAEEEDKDRHERQRKPEWCEDGSRDKTKAKEGHARHTMHGRRHGTLGFDDDMVIVWEREHSNKREGLTLYDFT